MKKAVIKFPFKLQDLIIIESARLFVDSNISVKTIDFSSSTEDYSSMDIVLGLGKEHSRCGDFLVSKCNVFNNRDIEYLDNLRFSNKVKGTTCVKLKNAISSLRKNLLSNEDKKSNSGVYSIKDVHTMLSTYTGYNDNIEDEYKKKSLIIREWLTEIITTMPADTINSQHLNDSLRSNLNLRFNLSLNFLSELKDCPVSNLLSQRLKKDLVTDIDEFLERKSINLQRSNLYNILNSLNYKHWINLWLDSRVEFSNKNSKYMDLWNSCDFSRPNVVINTTGTIITDWKKLAKLEEETIVFFMTPERGSDNWSIISLSPSKFPMVDSDLPYWTHVSKFLSKFESYEKANKYLDVLLGTYSDTLTN